MYPRIHVNNGINTTFPSTDKFAGFIFLPYHLKRWSNGPFRWVSNMCQKLAGIGCGGGRGGGGVGAIYGHRTAPTTPRWTGIPPAFWTGGVCGWLELTPPNFDEFPADVPYSAYQRMQTIRRKAKRGWSEVSRSVQFNYLSGSVIHSARYLSAPNHLCFGTRDIWEWTRIHAAPSTRFLVICCM